MTTFSMSNSFLLVPIEIDSKSQILNCLFLPAIENMLITIDFQVQVHLESYQWGFSHRINSCKKQIF